MRLIEANTQDQLDALSVFNAQARDESGTDPVPPNGPMGAWLIDSPDGLIGSVGIYGVNWTARRCRGMIYISPTHRGNGLAALAHKLLEAKVFDEFNLRRLEGVIRDDNAQMIALMESVGAVREGELKDVSYEDGRYRTYLMYRFMREE